MRRLPWPRNVLKLALLECGHRTEPSVIAIANGDYLQRSYDALAGNGYVIESLESALWYMKDDILAMAEALYRSTI